MRRAALVLATAGLLAIAPAALSAGPSGSHEEDSRQACIDGAGQEVPRNPDGTCPTGSTDTTVTEWDNEVTCSGGQDVGGAATVYVGPNGVEGCNDGTTLPIQGRVIATSDDGGDVAADGDASNPEDAQGFIRVDGSGVHCGDPGGRLDSTSPGSTDTADHCGPQQ